MTAVTPFHVSVSRPDAPAPRVVAPAAGLAPLFPNTRADASGRLFEMQHAFRSTGGVITGDALTGVLRRRSDQPLSLLARWIVNRDVVSFEAHGQTWLPMFQFDPATLSVVRSVKQVIGELRDVFDDWELTEWFASPNSWLDGVTPANALASDADAVVQAARADRFVAAG